MDEKKFKDWYDKNKINDRYSENIKERDRNFSEIDRKFKKEAKNYSKDMANARYRSKTQKLIDKYSKTDGEDGLNEKGLRKKSRLDSKKERYASKQYKKINSDYDFIKDRVYVQRKPSYKVTGY